MIKVNVCNFSNGLLENGGLNINCSRNERLGLKPCGLGNPFHIGKDGDRDEVCRKFDEYFGSDEGIVLRNKIKNIIGSYDGIVNLYCFCAPLKCHTETYKNFILLIK